MAVVVSTSLCSTYSPQNIRVSYWNIMLIWTFIKERFSISSIELSPVCRKLTLLQEPDRGV